MESEEPSWIHRAKGGDQQACRRLFELYEKRLMSYFRHRVDSYADAEDLMQECFLRAFLNLDKVKRSSLQPFLFTIAHNLIVDFLRTNSDPAKSLEPLDDVGGRATSAEATEHQLELHELEACMDRIFLPIQKSVFLAAYRDGCTQKELTESFDLPMTTINNWISRRDLINRLVRELSRSASDKQLDSAAVVHDIRSHGLECGGAKRRGRRKKPSRSRG